MSNVEIVKTMKRKCGERVYEVLRCSALTTKWTQCKKRACPESFEKVSTANFDRQLPVCEIHLRIQQNLTNAYRFMSYTRNGFNELEEALGTRLIVHKCNTVELLPRSDMEEFRKKYSKSKIQEKESCTSRTRKRQVWKTTYFVSFHSDKGIEEITKIMKSTRLDNTAVNNFNYSDECPRILYPYPRD